MVHNLDIKDKKLLYELDKNSHQTNKQIAKHLRLSEQVVGNRIRRLQESGVVEYFFIKINPATIGNIHIKIYFRFHNITKEREHELISDICTKKNIFWIASLKGKYDLVTSFYVRNISDFSSLYETIFGKWGEYIIEKNAIVLENAYTYSKAYLVHEEESKEIIYGSGEETQYTLDKTDMAVLEILNNQGRMSAVEMAVRLKISPDAVRYRIRNLEKSNIITGYGAKINFRALNINYNIVFLKLQNMNKVKYRKLETIAKMNKNIIIFIRTIGSHDIELETETTSIQEFDDLINLLRNQFALELKDYEILEVTKEHRMTYFPF